MQEYLEEDIALVDRRIDRCAGPVPRKPTPDFLFMMIDLDSFKPVNDTYGHAAGDQVLCEVRDILRRVCRQSDTLIRWGGDEFLVVGRDIDRSAAARLSERILEAITGHRFDLGAERTARLGCSIGFAFYPFVPADPSLVPWERALAIADRAMYLVKDGGKSAWAGVVCTERPIPPALASAVDDWPDVLIREGYALVSSSLTDLQVPEPRDPALVSS